MNTLTEPHGSAFAVAILAGGQSRRMGRDKAQIQSGGVSWLERTARVAAEAARDVAVIGRSRPDNWALESVAFLDDAAPGLGPLGGLLAALRWADGRGEASSGVLALACDTPEITAEAVRWLFEAAARTRPSHGLAVLNGGRLEPLFSIYGAACLPLIERRLSAPPDPAQRGRFSLRGLIEASGFNTIEAPYEIAAQLRNVNTPQDLKSLEAAQNHP